MSHKKEAYATAAEHGMTIDNYASSQRGEMWGNIAINLPAGYQLSPTDERTGLTSEAGGMSYNDFWKYVRMDIAELLSFKDEWTKI